MKNMKLVVAQESPEVSSFPRLLSFPQGVPIEHHDMQIVVSQKGAGKKRKSVLSAALNGVTFSASDIGEFSSKNDLYKYAIGILNEKTGEITLQSAEHAYVMRPVITGRADVLRESSLSYAERKQSLTEEFGSRKKKRALLAAQSNTISAENISGAATVEHVMASSLSAEDLDQSSSMIDAAEQALEENRMKLLPPYNEAATDVEDAYPLDGLLPSAIAGAIGDHYDALLASLAAAGESTEESTATSKRSLFELFSTRFGSGVDSFAILSIGLHAAFPPSLPSEIKKKSDKKTIKDKMCQVLMLEYCLWMYREFANHPFKQVGKEELIAALSDAPHTLFKHLVDNFSTYKKQNGKPAYVLTKAHSDKLVLYIIILALRIGDFSLDLSVLAQDLKLPGTAISALARETGCRVLKNKSAGTSNGDVDGVHLIADLSVPLKFPKRMGGGKKGR